MTSGSGPSAEPRHARQLMLREIGGPGQAKLAAATVGVVGAGGLGGPAALLLAAAGVGTIRIWDDDAVELSNLQRQIQFGEGDVGAGKADALADRVRALDGGLRVEAHGERIGDNAAEALRGCDVVLDCTDSFASRYGLNRATRELGVALVSGAAAGWRAQVGVFNASPGAPCYRCFVPEPPPDAPDCETVGIVGAVVAVAGGVQALEAVKLITGAGRTLSGRLWIWDGLAGEARTVSVAGEPDCPVCG